MLSAKFIAHPLGDLPLRGLYVALVPGQDHHEFFLVIIIDHFVDPEVHTVKTFLVREIIADDGGILNSRARPWIGSVLSHPCPRCAA